MPVATEPLLLGGTARIENPRVDWLDLIGRVPAGTNPKTLEAQLQSELHGWLASHVADMSPQGVELCGGGVTLRLSPGGAGFSSLRRYCCEQLAAADVHGLPFCYDRLAPNIANLLLALVRSEKPVTDGGGAWRAEEHRADAR